MTTSRYIVSILTCLIVLKSFSQKRPVMAREAAWVSLSKYDYNVQNLDNQAEEGYVDLVYEEQVSVETQSVYCRKVMKILTEAGIQNSSQISVDFDPSYQHLTFHSIKIIRGDKILDQLNLSKIKTIQQEKELDRFMYDGSLSAVLFLEDLRKNDIIEYSYTVTGFNPIFKGLYAYNFEANFAVPIYNIFYKLVLPKGRSVTIKNKLTNIQPSISTPGGQTVYEWKISNVPALHVQDNLPSWYDPYSLIMVSEYKSWKQVGDWAAKLFEIPRNLSQSLREKINEIKAKEFSAEDRVLAALRFVQDDIHYMGIEMGANSHQPNPPDKVIAQRFGDCKDKSYLLCTMLHFLEVECVPVYINTDLKKSLLDYLPSPRVFNHATVRIKLEDGYHWFDPTISYQRGHVNDISYPDYQYGLVIGENADSLTKIGVHEPGMVNVNEIFDVKKMMDSVRFIVITKYSGSFADNVRSDFNSNSRYEMQKNYRTFYVDYYKDIVSDSLDYENDDSTGIFTTKEYYSIPHIWEMKDGKQKASFSPYVIDGIIKKPKETARTMPYGLVFPAHYKEDIEINLPEDWNGEQSSTHLENDGFRLSADFSYSNRKFLLKYEYESLKDNISTAEAARFLNDLNRKEESFDYELSENDRPVISDSETGSSDNHGITIAEAVLFLLVLGTIWWRRRR